MNSIGVVYLAIAGLMGLFIFRISLSMGWNWGLGIFLALIPAAATYFLGLIGLLASALFLGALIRGSD